MGEDNEEEDDVRKHQAKRWNEHIKLIATTLNAIALVILAAAALQPFLPASMAIPCELAAGVHQHYIAPLGAWDHTTDAPGVGP